MDWWYIIDFLSQNTLSALERPSVFFSLFSYIEESKWMIIAFISMATSHFDWIHLSCPAPPSPTQTSNSWRSELARPVSLWCLSGCDWRARSCRGSAPSLPREVWKAIWFKIRLFSFSCSSHKETCHILRTKYSSIRSERLSGFQCS